MKDSNIYLPLWQKYRLVIISKMIMAIESTQEYPLFKHEFEAIGERISSGYAFNLEIKNGILQNNIDGTAVARDLYEVLKGSESAKAIMKSNNFKINLTKDFKLIIQTKA